MLTVINYNAVILINVTFWNISPDGSRLQREFNAISLILVEFTILVLLFAFILKCNDNKANENINHKKCDNNYIYDIKYGNKWTVIIDWTIIFSL